MGLIQTLMQESTLEPRRDCLVKKKKIRSYRSEAHLLNVIQLIDESNPSATAVLIQIARCRRRPITSCKPVGHDLIDRLSPPFGWSETIRQDNTGEDGRQETNGGRHGESAENR